MNLAPFILASASPRRCELLRQLGQDFEVMPSAAVEYHHEQFTARELALLNACRKARSVARLYPGATVLGADTLVSLGTQLYGKPSDRGEACRMLEELQGKTHQVVTGVCLMQLARGRHAAFAEITHVRFKPLRAEQIEQYLASIDPLDKAGAYAIQEGGDALVEHISGSYSNVVGLPLERLRAELTKWAETN
jgi:septum formation protein